MMVSVQIDFTTWESLFLLEDFCLDCKKPHNLKIRMCKDVPQEEITDLIRYEAKRFLCSSCHAAQLEAAQ